MVNVVEIGKKKPLQPEDMHFQCQANSLENTSAYFFFFQIVSLLFHIKDQKLASL